MIIGPQVTRRFGSPTDDTIPVADIIDIARNNKWLIFWQLFEYNDIFTDIIRQSEICCRIRVNTLVEALDNPKVESTNISIFPIGEQNRVI